MDRVYLNDRPTCCGFIKNEINTTISCLIWTALSFYFAVLSFLGKSPFYSYISTVALVAFGAANLLLGLMSLVASIIFIIQKRTETEFRISTGNHSYRFRNNRITYAVTLSVVAVLVTALVSFILFASQKQEYLDWCISSSTSYVNATYNEVNAASNLTAVNLSTSVDYYNCDRLFQGEIKWGLMCLTVIMLIYLHWVVILNTVRSENFCFDQFTNTVTLMEPPPHIPPPMVGGEFNNIPPQKRGIHSLSNIKPSKLKMSKKFKLFQKKTVNGTKLPTQNEMEKSPSNINIMNKQTSEIADDSQNQGRNIIYFEDNIYNSKEEVIEPIENRRPESNSSKRPDSSATLVNMSS